MDTHRGGGKSLIQFICTGNLPNLQIQTECLHTLTQSTAC